MSYWSLTGPQCSTCWNLGGKRHSIKQTLEWRITQLEEKVAKMKELEERVKMMEEKEVRMVEVEERLKRLEGVVVKKRSGGGWFWR